MPYLTEADRKYADTYGAGNPGALNYLITELAIEYAANMGGNYAAYNEVVGVLECAKLEFYRRAVSAYEDEKIKANGDVYPVSV